MHVSNIFFGVWLVDYIQISKITHICSHTCACHNSRTNLSSKTKMINTGGKSRGDKGEGNKLNMKFIYVKKVFT